jgi:hypothetical protein
MNFQWWVSASKAKSLGCTHRARFLGLIPGFCSTGDVPMWVSRSDLLNPLEDLVGFIWSVAQANKGDEPSFMFKVGAEI